jgi:hypothetical protein
MSDPKRQRFIAPYNLLRQSTFQTLFEGIILE